MTEPRFRLLLYGATGFTGRLIARTAATYGLTPIIAGRNEADVIAVAGAHGLPFRVFEATDDTMVRTHLEGVDVVLNCAGPFVRTWQPLVFACLAARVHYVDITGEVAVLEGIAALGEQARAAGVMLLPGAGFDVVPSDCLAAHVARRLPSATRLLIGIRGSGRLSHGTAATALDRLGDGGLIRRGGHITRVPAAWRTRRIDFGHGPRLAVTIPWGDVATAWHSTGIPDVEVYAALPRRARAAVRASRHLGWLLRRRAVHRILLQFISARPRGPSEEELERGLSVVWARAEDASGAAVEARLHGPNGYTLTAHAALLAVRRILDGDVRAGFQTPSRAFGEDFVLQVPGTRREDVSSP